jgi:hypothetical protein
VRTENLLNFEAAFRHQGFNLLKCESPACPLTFVVFFPAVVMAKPHLRFTAEQRNTHPLNVLLLR